MNKPEREMEFEALRGLSIVLLLTLHSEIYDPIVFGETLKDIGVFVASFLLGSFFFLAGYFTEVSLKKPATHPIRFIWSKFIRIYPPYWIALVLFIYFMEYSLRRRDLAVYLLNLQVVFSPAFVKPLLTLWYISMLVVFYALIGGMMFSLRSSAGLLAAAVALYVFAFIAHRAWGLFEPRFFQYYFIFLAGVFFCRFENIRNRMLGWNAPVKIVIAALGVFLLQWQLNSGDASQGLYLLAVDFFILGWILLWLSLFRTWLGNWRLWSWLSAASFFTYLFHRPLWRLIDIIFGLEAGMGTVMVHLIPGSLLALLLGYFLQLAYDRLLALMHLK